MLKQGLFYLLLSLLAVVFSRYGHMVVIGVDMLFTTVNGWLAMVFSSGYIGETVRKVLVLAGLPVAITAVPALIYRLVKGSTMPWFFEITWMVWLIVALSNVMIR
ncbi:hypothetical protein Lgee_0903 [Legionella geestiana]|uniref:Uncharacterized protein n=1 Tax=Legionella geestiana TaxID=45065 RepID=A0A0W0TYV9_9GAMM|nr:hypothetical protein [Legionella geestiana]KTD00639.1 hypothetical protein Lgee_0903 [Legionella geestiana]QBS11746.1 hypothetical protein E4T54_02745 [Legionella geestiana]QDQ40642.1 hypothetical protein E3226_009675 [Legionella geestiana]STX53563.1 Uncharacterised protein [Legionella geestiana]